jgi:hypothetical protein
MLNFNQLSLFDIDSHFREYIIKNNSSFFDYFHDFINFSDLIPFEFYRKYYKHFGAKRTYSLESMLLLLIYKSFLGISNMNTLLNILADSEDLRFALGLPRLPDKSTISKFKNSFVNELDLFLATLVDEINPLLEEYFNDLHKNLIVDTTGIEAYVTENNPKFLQTEVRKAKNYKKQLKSTDPQKSKNFDHFKFAFGNMPKKASANSDIKFAYLNGHFGYYLKAVIITDGLGIIQDIQFPDDIKEFTNDKMPKEIKDEFDAISLIPSLELFKTKHDLSQFNNFLGDSGFDAVDNYKYLYQNDLQPFISINKRAAKSCKSTLFTKDNDDTNFYYDEQGNLICKQESVKMKYNGTFKEKGRATRISFRCPKIKTKTINGKTTPFNTCKSPCTDAKWGRKVNIPIDHNYRFNTSLPRASEKWQIVFKTRPVCERSINQFKQCININSSFVRKTSSLKADVFLAAITQVISALILIKSNELEHILSIKSLAS